MSGCCDDPKLTDAIFGFEARRLGFERGPSPFLYQPYVAGARVPVSIDIIDCAEERPQWMSSDESVITLGCPPDLFHQIVEARGAGEVTLFLYDGNPSETVLVGEPTGYEAYAASLVGNGADRATARLAEVPVVVGGETKITLFFFEADTPLHGSGALVAPPASIPLDGAASDPATDLVVAVSREDTDRLRFTATAAGSYRVPIAVSSTAVFDDLVVRGVAESELRSVELLQDADGLGIAAVLRDGSGRVVLGAACTWSLDGVDVTDDAGAAVLGEQVHVLRGSTERTLSARCHGHTASVTVAAESARVVGWVALPGLDPADVCVEGR